jgi:hypothetical protein
LSVAGAEPTRFDWLPLSDGDAERPRKRYHAERGNEERPRKRYAIVRIPSSDGDAKRPRKRYHAERGNEEISLEPPE